jgi:hypothetical protein
MSWKTIPKWMYVIVFVAITLCLLARFKYGISLALLGNALIYLINAVTTRHMANHPAKEGDHSVRSVYLQVVTVTALLGVVALICQAVEQKQSTTRLNTHFLTMSNQMGRLIRDGDFLLDAMATNTNASPSLRLAIVDHERQVRSVSMNAPSLESLSANFATFLQEDQIREEREKLDREATLRPRALNRRQAALPTFRYAIDTLTLMLRDICKGKTNTLETSIDNIPETFKQSETPIGEIRMIGDPSWKFQFIIFDQCHDQECQFIHMWIMENGRKWTVRYDDKFISYRVEIPGLKYDYTSPEFAMSNYTKMVDEGVRRWLGGLGKDTSH